MGLFSGWFGSKDTEKPQRAQSATRPGPKSSSGRSAFTGAQGGDLTYSWSQTAQHMPINAFLKTELVTLRARSRELFRNDPYLKRFVSLMKSNVIGVTGIEMIPDARGKRLNESVSAAWSDWCKFGNCDITGTHNFTSFLNLYLITWLVDGEVFVRVHRDQEANSAGYSLELIDPALIDISYQTEVYRPTGNRISCGIEFNNKGRPVAYHMTGRVGDDVYQIGGRDKTRVPAEEMFHRFTIEYAGQLRGIPAAAPAMYRIKMLEGYEEAEVTAARVSASKMGFFKRSLDGAGYEGEQDESDGSRIMDASPGTFEELDPGVDLTTFDPQHGGKQYGEFIKSVLRGIASALGVSYNSLSNDLEGVNFSSIRTSVLEDRELYKAAQSWIIDTFLDPMFDQWKGAAGLAGLFSTPGSARVVVRWQGRRWSWVDPAKDMTAAEKAVGLKLKSRAELIRESGRNPEDVFAEVEEEAALFPANEPSDALQSQLQQIGAA
ncbi:phage portal protein [Vibrio cyclitrophicus]